MVTLLVIMKSVSLEDLVGCSIRVVVQIWGHLSKVQFKDWAIWKLALNTPLPPQVVLQNICLLLGFKLYFFLCQSDSNTVTLGEPKERELGQKGEINGWSSNVSCIPVCTNAVHELKIMGHRSRETSELSIFVAAAFQAVKEWMWYTVAMHGLEQSWQKSQE